MTGRETNQPEDWLFLQSRLSDIARLPAWIESLASRQAIPKNIEFAINVCLEEAISNIIRHGYGTDVNGSVTVRFTMPRQDLFVFMVEDEAQRFNPLDVLTSNLCGTVRVGGQGINLLRQFSDALEYEATLNGNRLKIAFSASNSVA
jgi:anti-sigma regulatory factor (Ser/Thr protein kinase)